MPGGTSLAPAELARSHPCPAAKGVVKGTPIGESEEKRDLLNAERARLEVTKSELASHYFPAWYLGKFPQHRVLLASYEAEFAESWGRKTRATFEQWGEHIFDLKISKRSKAANRWDIHGKTGGMYTAGVGGAAWAGAASAVSKSSDKVVATAASKT